MTGTILFDPRGRIYGFTINAGRVRHLRFVRK
jgi:hypothetical protein